MINVLKDIGRFIGMLAIFVVPVLGIMIYDRVDLTPLDKKGRVLAIFAQIIGSALALEQLGNIFGV